MNSKKSIINEEEIEENFDLKFQKEKTASIGELIDGITHQILSPLTGIITSAESIIKLNDDTNYKKNKIAKRILKATSTIETIIKNLQEFSLAEYNNFQEVDLTTVLEKSLQLIKPMISHEYIDLTLNIESNLPIIKCRPQRTQAVFINILTNSIQALNDKFERASREKKINIDMMLKDENIRINFFDNGIGILEENMNKIFEPFFTTRKRKSLGLGLSTSYNIILQHFGTLIINSEYKEWTEVIIDIPIRRER